MKKMFFWACALLLSFGFMTAVSASPIIPDDLLIDFRDNSWDVDGNTQSKTVDYTFVKVTATAKQYDLSSEDSSWVPLWQDEIDGLGIDSGVGEEDEIEKFEWLVIDFDPGVYLEGFWITDLFDAPDGDNLGEVGTAWVRDSNSGIFEYTFDGNNTANGEVKVDFNQHTDVVSGLNVLQVVFLDDNWLTYFESEQEVGSAQQNLGGREFSVAGFYGPTPVPEPTALILLGTGLLGIGVLGRKRLFK